MAVWASQSRIAIYYAWISLIAQIFLCRKWSTLQLRYHLTVCTTGGVQTIYKHDAIGAYTILL